MGAIRAMMSASLASSGVQKTLEILTTLQLIHLLGERSDVDGVPHIAR